MTAPEPLGSAWLFTALHREDPSALPPRPLLPAACCSWLLETWEQRASRSIYPHVEAGRKRQSASECMWDSSSFRMSLDFIFMFFCSLSFTFALQSVCLFVPCSQHYISRPADHMLAAGLSQFNTDRLASSASSACVHAWVCVCVCVRVR